MTSGRVAVLGAGVTGLTAAYELAKAGMNVDVYERWPGLGGMAATLDVGEGVLLERYYHHLFTTDLHIASLYRELGLEDGIDWLPSSVAFFRDGHAYPFTTPLDLLRFKPLSLRARLRMGLVLLQRRNRSADALEHLTAADWIRGQMGEEAWRTLWGPLLRGKFGSRAEDITMAWLWARLTVRRQAKGQEARGEVLGYPRGGFEPLFTALRQAIEERGGRVLIDRPAASLSSRDGGFEVVAGAEQSFRRGHDPREFERAESDAYDAVLATVPNDVFEGLLDPPLAEALGDDYLDRLRGIEYHAALCLLLELDRQFGNYYWTNVGDPDLPFIGLIEQGNLTTLEQHGGRRFLYVANYVEHDDRLLGLSPDELIAAYEPGLRKMNPAFDLSWIREAWLHREPSAQPVVTVGYRERLAPIVTPVAGLLLANTTHVYPEDRGTNYAVRLGRGAAEALLRSRT